LLDRVLAVVNLIAKTFRGTAKQIIDTHDNNNEIEELSPKNFDIDWRYIIKVVACGGETPSC
jgi:hypothetical protein